MSEIVVLRRFTVYKQVMFKCENTYNINESQKPDYRGYPMVKTASYIH